MTEPAIKKLEEEYKKTSGDRYGEVVKKPLLETLENFCRQSGEFAQAVFQGGSFQEALAAAVKGASNHTPDIQIYRQAVRYYFPGADIRLTMRIFLCEAERPAEEPEEAAEKPEKRGILLDLADYL